MSWLYLLIAVFAVMAVCLIYSDYKKGKFSKKAFLVVCVLETIAAIGSVILFILSL